MKTILFGATGMIGSGVLLECLDEPAVTSVLAVGRSPLGIAHAKLRDLRHEAFFDFTAIRDELAGHDACFFCLGVSAAGMSEARYHRVTFEMTIAAADVLAGVNPGMKFCYLSAEGADSTERGRFMWARVKGKTENQLLRMPLDAYMFRPGIVQPLKGVKSKTRVYQAAYVVLAPLHPLLRRVFPTHVTTTENIGKAMIGVARDGYAKRILENDDINRVAGRGQADQPGPAASG